MQQLTGEYPFRSENPFRCSPVTFQHFFKIPLYKRPMNGCFCTLFLIYYFTFSIFLVSTYSIWQSHIFFSYLQHLSHFYTFLQILFYRYISFPPHVFFFLYFRDIPFFGDSNLSATLLTTNPL